MNTCTRASLLAACFILSLHAAPLSGNAAEAKSDLKEVSLNGGLGDGKARLTIEAVLNGLQPSAEKLIYSTVLQHSIRVSRDQLSHVFTAKVDVLQGKPNEFTFTLEGKGEIKEVTGKGLQDWSVRQSTNGVRLLVLRPNETNSMAQFVFRVAGQQALDTIEKPLVTLAMTPSHPALFSGYVRVEAAPELNLQVLEPSGAAPVEFKYLPEEMRSGIDQDAAEPLAFRFFGSAYSIPLSVRMADPDSRRVVLRDFGLTGRLRNRTAEFTLRGQARITDPRGGVLKLLSGNVALNDLQFNPDWQVEFDKGQFNLRFDKAGEFPIQIQFNAGVRQSNGWNAVDFKVAPSSLQPIVLQGLPAGTQFQFAGAARPERRDPDYVSYLPPSGNVQLSWKEAPREAEGRLFYAAETLSQISLSPGLMRETALLDFKVMQGEVTRVTLRLHGAGEVTRVQGDHVLAWSTEPLATASDRRLVVQLNEAQKDHFILLVQVQAALGAFPQTVEAVRIQPENAVRFTGYVRVENEGAVRLEIAESTGLSQISPEQFPESDATRAAFRSPGGQRFAYRFSGAEFTLRIRADQILPEVSVSEIVHYQLGEAESALDAEVELDIREAALRELNLRVPKGYAVARLSAAGMSDYALRDTPDQAIAELRIVYGQPVLGRQLLQLRLERNQPLGSASWALPRLEVLQSKAVRGHVAVSAEAGLRLSLERVQGLTEIATAFFPKKVAGIQTAFRIASPAWEASVRVERLPQSLQVDALHLFSIGEGVAYGSSVLNYIASGAPVSSFRVDLSSEYFNVEFTGKDIRSWQKTTNGYVVQLHTPVTGAYALLATYERPFRAQGETLPFMGARPLDAQSEQGHTIVISAYQFQVQPVEVSPGLAALEPGEVPAEYRLLFEAPVLAAYRYASRPFTLRLGLTPLAQGDSLKQVIDRALLVTHVSKAGQVVTDARYFLKNRGNSHLRLTVPSGTELWSATVDGANVVPVADGQQNLIPLPQRADPNAALLLDLKLAAKSASATRVTVASPVIAAPIMGAEWRLEPDTGQRLVYRTGSLAPVGGVTDQSGFTGLLQALRSERSEPGWLSLSAGLGLILLAVLVWRWTIGEGVYRFTARHVAGAGVGLIALAFALAAFLKFGLLLHDQPPAASRAVTFFAPVQQAGNALTVQVNNWEENAWTLASVGPAWPAILALAIWVLGLLRGWGVFGRLAGWLLLAWAALRSPNGAVPFLVVLLLFLHAAIVIPVLYQLFTLPKRPPLAPSAGPAGATAPALMLLLASLFLPLFATEAALAGADEAAASQGDQSNQAHLPVSGSSNRSEPLADSVLHQIVVQDSYVSDTVRIHWRAAKGQLLPILFEPAVLTGALFQTNRARLVQAPSGNRGAQQWLALENGTVDGEFHYQLQVQKRDQESGFVLPTQFGLINKIDLTLMNLDVEVFCNPSVSIQRVDAQSNTVAQIVLPPVNAAWVAWRPRSRDTRAEKPIFYAELHQVYVPSAGVVEGAHSVLIRPAQGQLTELALSVPPGMTITDVIDPPLAEKRSDQTDAQKAKPGSSLVALWRFDPDARKLRVTLTRAQARPFSIVVRSQISCGPLPFEQSIGLISVDNAASQPGLLACATGSDVQLENATGEGLAPINLEDFPTAALLPLQERTGTLAVRRAYRYTDAAAKVALRAAAVEPDVRVEAQSTLSLGEDRTLLVMNATVNVARAGIFRLSFPLPAGFDVETISSEAMSHWTESRTDAARLITLNLRGKTEGQQTFAITLAGAGIKTNQSWAVPQVVFREAAKQQGNLLIVPEQGMRLQVAARDGVTQLDPQKSGIRQKGVLAFRILPSPWKITLEIEQLDSWIQVTSLQHATINEAGAKVAANLQYQIENTGVKLFNINLATNAENVQFQGEQISDFRPMPGSITNGVQRWEVKLHRRVIGSYLLHVVCQLPLAERATQTSLRGIQAADANLQRGFLTLEGAGRLQLRVDTIPAALQPTEWQAIPRALQQNLPTTGANFAYRLVESSFELPLRLDRHQAAKLLAGRVNSVTLTSAISDDGVTLTQVRLDMIPGDKRLLYLTLPPDAHFWFAFVNQNGVWPWRENDRILVPLELQARDGRSVPVEIYYSTQSGGRSGRSLDLELLAPKFDLPLENVTWRVFLNEKWRLQHWAGSLQLEEQALRSQPAFVDVETYLKNEAAAQREKSKIAEQMLVLGNSALEKGDPQQARRAFQAAFGLSQGDNAFNEDARVQLNNLKLQQALVGLNVRQTAAAGGTDTLAAKLRDNRDGNAARYTQQDAKALLERNTADENAAFMRLAQRLIQQQEAAASSPAAIHAAVPEQGRLLTFRRAVVVDSWADLRIRLGAGAVRAAPWAIRLGIIALLSVFLSLCVWASRSFRRPDATPVIS